MKKWIGTQIVLNNIANNILQRNDYLKKKISLAKDTLDLDTLIVWPDSNEKNLDLIREICSGFKIKIYLWYPILADISLFKIRPNQAVETFDGLHGYGVNGCWEKLGQREEDFLFLCPNDEQRIRKIFNYYQKQIIEGSFDGVFLDRIRFPSPANGLETLFTCFCKSCLEKFHTNCHEDLNHYRSRVKDFFREFKDIDIRDLSACRTLFDMIVRDNLKRFFDFRAQSIYQVTKMFTDEAKKRGKLVGLDLFAPSIAPLVAQDYRLLAETCDWMKPMVYCYTSGPAGLPLELSCFIKAILNINPALSEDQLIQEVGRMLGVQLPGEINDLLKKGVPANIIYYEMQRIKNFDLREGIKIYIGLEAVQIPGICHVNRSILEKYLSSVLEIGIEGMVISWNLLKIPDENLKIVGDFLLNQ